MKPIKSHRTDRNEIDPFFKSSNTTRLSIPISPSGNRRKAIPSVDSSPFRKSVSGHYRCITTKRILHIIRRTMAKRTHTPEEVSEQSRIWVRRRQPRECSSRCWRCGRRRGMRQPPTGGLLRGEVSSSFCCAGEIVVGCAMAPGYVFFCV